MNIVQINGMYRSGSTGRIMYDLHHVIERSDNSGFMVSAYGKSDEEDKDKLLSTYNSFSSINPMYNLLISRITGLMGYRYKLRTKKIIKWIDEKKPDIIHLHNIHGDWINLKVLFEYLKGKNVHVIWTLHDCWAFTGRCSHFENCKCFKWRTGCYNCPNKQVYPITYFFDWSRKMWLDKQTMFTSLEKLTIVTPSDWLGNYVRQSYLSQYPIVTIHNGIDLNVFKQCKVRNDLRYIAGERKIILGVASTWTERKGLYDFYKLSELIGDKFLIILVGLNEKQLKAIPDTIYGISRTNSIEELVNLYNAAEYFVNLTYLDNYPTTNLEAQACGTPTITYNTGGSSESVFDNGFVVEQGDLQKVAQIIMSGNHRERVYYRNIAESNFSAEICFKQYLSLYEKTIVE